MMQHHASCMYDAYCIPHHATFSSIMHHAVYLKHDENDLKKDDNLHNDDDLQKEDYLKKEKDLKIKATYLLQLQINVI